jgi:hypothetical protein
MSGDEITLWWAAEPKSWAEHARRLDRSTGFLWHPIERMFDVEFEAAKKGITPHGELDYDEAAWQHFYAFFLVAGAALETMLKALAIQVALNKKGPSGVMLTGNRLRSEFATHDLEQLARMAGLALHPAHEHQLRRFTMYITWAGRYPIPKKPAVTEEHGETWFDYIGVNSSDRSLYQQIFRVIEDAYERASSAPVVKEDL